MAKPALSKSRYLSGLQCVKKLYFETSSNADAVTARKRAAKASPVLEVGTAVGVVAREQYLRGVLIGAEDHAGALAETESALATAPAIFEGAFEFGGVRVRADILARASKSWQLLEVKSSTQLKDTHLDDLALQVYVLEGAGLQLEGAGIMHLDGTYERGQKLDLSQLFATEQLLPQARARTKHVAENLERFKPVAARASAPKVAPGPHCNKPHDCPFQGVCIPEPGRHSLLRLPDGRRLEKRLKALGVKDASKLTDEHRATPVQRRAAAALVSGKPQVAPVLGRKLAALRYPLHFIDFETVMFAVPRYPRTRPFQQVPCQWSLHIEQRDGSVEHHGEFLHDEDSDPREAFIRSLLEALDGPGDVLVYSAFEVSRLTEIAEAFPRYAKRIQAVVSRVQDLLATIKEGFYHPKFDGSFSIKSVLPALTGISYADLEIHNGAQAASEYERMIVLPRLDGTRKQIRSNLLAYCERDTLAMVEVLKKLRSAVSAASKSR